MRRVEKRIEELEKRVVALEGQVQKQQDKNITINIQDAKTPEQVAADLKKIAYQLANKL